MNNEKPTKVVFLMTPKDKFCDSEVMAFMPEEKWNIDGTTKTCYMHTGQHGPCSELYALECKIATPKKYKGLLFELKVRMGYTIEVLDASEWKKSNGERKKVLKKLDRELVETRATPEYKVA